MVTQILTQFGVPAEDLSHGERFLRGEFAGYVSTSDPSQKIGSTPRNHPKINGSSLLIVGFRRQILTISGPRPLPWHGGCSSERKENGRRLTPSMDLATTDN